MPRLRRTREQARPPAASQANAEPLEPGAYVTDRVSLYRVVTALSWPPRESFAVLEDCLTLDTLALSADELHKLELELVREAAGRSGRAVDA